MAKLQREFSANKRIEFYKALLRIRITELALAERYKNQEMRTPTHFGVGQEAVAVGVCQNLAKEDVVYSHHRSHNHYLAQGGSIFSLAAELFGRVDGCSNGRGGSVHLTAREHGFIASSAILGETIAAATGSALSFSMDAKAHVAVTFFGDAAAEEGILYECMNFASINKLPVLFVCENNGYATESPLNVRQPVGTSLCVRAEAFQIIATKVDGNDLDAVSVAAQKFIVDMRESPGPRFLECSTYRWLEHVGPYFDHEMQRIYRSKEELELWQSRCPVHRYEKALLSDKIVSAEEIQDWQDEIQTHVNSEIDRAYLSPWPEVSTLFDNTY